MQQQYAIESLELAVASLEPNPWNPNEMNGFMLDKAEESLDRFGQVKRIIVRPHPKKKGFYQILDGQHRCKLAQKLGIETIRCEVIHDISDKEAKRLGLALNDIHGENDRAKLGKLLCEIQAEDDEEALPWNEDELSHLMCLPNNDEDTEGDEVEEFGEPGEEFSQENFEFISLKLAPAALDKLEQCISLLQPQLPATKDRRELVGMVVEFLCDEYL